MWWQAAGVIVSLVTAVGGLGLGIAGFVRSGRAEDAQLRSSATEVGLETLKFAQRTQRDEFTRLIQTVGELRGQLDECMRQREHQERQLAEQSRELAELRQMLT